LAGGQGGRGLPLSCDSPDLEEAQVTLEVPSSVPGAAAVMSVPGVDAVISVPRVETWVFGPEMKLETASPSLLVVLVLPPKDVTYQNHGGPHGLYFASI